MKMERSTVGGLDNHRDFSHCFQIVRSVLRQWRAVGTAAPWGLLVLIVSLLSLLQPAHADDGKVWVAEYVWAPQFCRENAGERSSEACNAYYGLVLRRLRAPSGYKCEGDLSEATLDAATRVIVSPRWVKQMWRKDGRCSGRAADSYFDLVSLISHKIEIPQIFREAPARTVQLSRSQLEGKILSVNRALRAESVALHCSSARLMQIDLCFDDHLDATACPVKANKACGIQVELINKK